MEIRVPFGSSYAYRYIGSIEQKEGKFLDFIEIKNDYNKTIISFKTKWSYFSYWKTWSFNASL